MNSLILVLGPGRSGTSLVAKLVAALGVDLGENLIPGNHSNPDGYFEDKSVIEHHKELLAAFGANNAYGGILPLPPDWIDSDVARRVEDWAVASLGNRFARNTRIGIKDPRISMLLPMWDRIVARCGARLQHVVCVRHPAAMAASLHKVAAIHPAVGEALWMTRIAVTFRHLGDNGLILDFDDIVADPHRSVSMLCEYVCGPAKCHHQRVDELLSQSPVKPDFRHAPASLDVIHPLAEALYRAVRAALEPGHGRAELHRLCDAVLESLHSTPGRNEAIRGVLRNAEKVAQLEDRLRERRENMDKLVTRAAQLREQKTALEAEVAQLRAAQDVLHSSHWVRIGMALKLLRSPPRAKLPDLG